MDIARPCLTAIFAIVGAVMPAVCFSEIVYLKEMPKEGDVLSQDRLRRRSEVPKGEVKEVTGGNREKATPRQVRCVKRPDRSPAK